MHQALYRKWRPQNFDEVCGQEHITNILRYETEKQLFSHAYLFCGSRGTGKTTCAKILARAVNCESPVGGNPCGKCPSCLAAQAGTTTDIVEMDAASNNKVDDVHTILDEVIYTPSLLRYRVYIVDEVHMLSSAAFNALLKTLEEPPEHVIFILATTEMQKLPATIISRCQRFDFHRIPTATIVGRLRDIAAAEQISVTDDAALMLARLAQGGMRDAISLLELCAAGGTSVTAESVSATVGSLGREGMSRTVRAIADRNCGELFEIIAGIDTSAKDIGVFWQELISYYRDMLVMRTANAASAIRYLDLTDAETAMLRSDAAAFSRETLIYHSRLLDDAFGSMQRPGASKRTVAEMTLVRMADEKLSTTPEALLSRIAALEAKLASGVIAAPAQVPPPADADRPPVPGEVPPPAAFSPAAPEPPKAAPTKPGERVLRPLRRWPEVIEAFRTTNAGYASMLANDRAFTDENGRILICYSKPMTYTLVSAPEVLRSLCSALSVTLERPIDPRNVTFEKVSPDEAPDNAKILMDELNELAGK